MKIKNILLASMIVGSSLMAVSSAYAAPVGKTTPVMLDDDFEGGFNAFFGSTFSSKDVGSSFIDKHTFTLTTNYDTSASITSSYLNSTKVKDLLITSFDLVQYDAASGVVLHTFTGKNTTKLETNPTDTWELSTTGLSAGSYYIKVGGDVLGTGGGSYASELTISAVPEPTTYGMMAAGLGLLGFVARRKKAKAA